MNEAGTTYRTDIRGSSVKIEQTAQGDFELFISDILKGTFSSATAAREKIISVLISTGNIPEKEIRNEVPLLVKWNICTTAPFDPEAS